MVCTRMIGMITLCAKNETYTECVLSVYSHDWDDHIVRKKTRPALENAPKRESGPKKQILSGMKAKPFCTYKKRTHSVSREHIL
jgi:hypothetical protein